MLQDITDETEILINSDQSLKHTIICIAGFLRRKYDTQSASNNDDDAQELTVSSEFTQQLDREGLSIPKLSTVFFVHTAVHIIVNLAHWRPLVVNISQVYYIRLCTASQQQYGLPYSSKHSTQGSRSSSQWQSARTWLFETQGKVTMNQRPAVKWI